MTIWYFFCIFLYFSVFREKKVIYPAAKTYKDTSDCGKYWLSISSGWPGPQPETKKIIAASKIRPVTFFITLSITKEIPASSNFNFTVSSSSREQVAYPNEVLTVRRTLYEQDDSDMCPCWLRSGM